MGKPRFAWQSWPSRTATGSDTGGPEDLLALARTHDAVAGRLAEQASRLDPSGSTPALRPLRWMVREHRIKALLLRGRAGCVRDRPPPRALG